MRRDKKGFQKVPDSSLALAQSLALVPQEPQAPKGCLVSWGLVECAKNQGETRLFLASNYKGQTVVLDLQDPPEPYVSFT